MKNLLCFYLILILFNFTSAQEENNEIFITWFGHACFEINYAGKNIVIDPFNPEWFGYSLPKNKIDYAFASHGHGDHNYFEGIDVINAYTASGDKDEFILNRNGETTSISGKVTEKINGKSFSFWTVPSFHDKNKGADRGLNGILCLDFQGLKVVHLGDLGHMLTKKQVETIGKVDVLLIPVGGFYTIDAAEAKRVAEQLNPKVLIPMHYKTDKVNLSISDEKEFVKLYKNVKKYDKSIISFDKKDLKEGLQVILLKYYGE